MYWDILEISPTSEISVIKKAYAKKLKIYHPEDDPEGFQRLKEAYDRAIKYAKHQAIQTTNVSKVASQIEGKIRVSELEASLENDRDYTSEHPQKYYLKKTHIDAFKDEIVDEMDSHKQLQEEFIQRIEALYNDFFSRILLKNWQEIFNYDFIWDFNKKESLNNIMLDFVVENQYLPKDVWQLLNSIFNWDEQEEHISLNYPKTFINYLRIQLSENNKLLNKLRKKGLLD